MKNINLTTILAFFSVTGFAQYMPIYDADTTTFEIGVHVPDAAVSAEIYVSGDTIINDQSYKKVWIDSEFDDASVELVGFTREDINEGKLWFKRMTDVTENLVMDLSLEVGDTFLLNEANYCQYSSDTQDMLVSSIDTVDGRKIIHLDCFSAGHDSLKFIEGVGPNSTIFFQTFDLTELGSLFYFNYGYTLCRMLKNDTVFYPDDGSELCDFTSFITGLDVFDSTIIFPNPTSGIINIEKRAKIKNISLYNTSGMRLEIQMTNANQFDMGALPKGLYFLKIESQKGHLSLQKVMKI